MFKPLGLYIGLRYTRAKRRNHFISFVSLASMLGIALGVMVLITTLSVMNGFDHEIRTRIFSIARQVTASTLTGSMPNWVSFREQVLHYRGIVGAAPFVEGQAMLNQTGQVQGVAVLGILPDFERSVSSIDAHITSGSLSHLKSGGFGIVLGEDLANSLGVHVGDKVTFITPTVNVSPAGLMPRFKSMTVVALFKVGNGFKFDQGLVFIHLQDAQKLFQLGRSVSGVRLKLTNLYDAPRMANELAHTLPAIYQFSDWTQEFGSFFQAIKLEKTMMFLMLLLIVAVAAFNLVSSLVMVVTDKKADIAILRTLGATPRMILSIFMIQGSVIGIIGTLLGLIGGVILALNITAWVSALEHFFHVQLLSSDVYYVNYLPSKLLWPDVIKICLTALLMSLLATLYPAWQAARVQPAEALRYE